MDYGASYVRSLKSINLELKKINERTKYLKKEKKGIEDRLYRYMERYNMNEYEGYKLEKLKPKPKIPTIRRKKKEKVEEGIRLLRDAGLPDPEQMYFELIKSQKPIPLTEN